MKIKEVLYTDGPMPILEAKLKQKGYNCTFTVTNEEKKIELFRNIREHEFYDDFIEPNLVKADLEKKWQSPLVKSKKRDILLA